MPTYWVYLNGEVDGPYEVEQLIRLRGFSRLTQVSLEDGSGKPSAWMSPAEIPELARIFKSVEEMQDAPTPQRTPTPKPVPPRAAPRPIARSSVVPAPPPKQTGHTFLAWIGGAALAASVIAGAVFWLRQFEHQAQKHERRAVQEMIETAPLPHQSRYATLRQCLQERHIQPQWDFEPMGDSLYHATLSWFTEPSPGVPASAVYAFEVNVPAQNIRGINTAAEKLLGQGFAEVAKTAGAQKPSAPPSANVASTLAQRAQSIRDGDFDKVWSLFSQRKRGAMIQAGISQSGFVRLQALTHRLESGQTLTVLKIKEENPSQRLVLLRQTQDKHPEILLKQTWVLEGGQWKLDDEEKHSSAAPETSPAETPNPVPTTLPRRTDAPAPTSPEVVPAAPSPAAAIPATTDKPAIPIQSLPGLSN